MLKVDYFQSEKMKQEGKAPEWSLWRDIASHSGGPGLCIDGKLHDMPASRMWEHVPNAPWFKTEDDAHIHFAL